MVTSRSPLAFFKFLFLKIFLSFVKGFQDVYGYGGLKLQTKKRVGGGEATPSLKLIFFIDIQWDDFVKIDND